MAPLRSTRARPSLCIAGPMPVRDEGRHALTQGELLADRFAAAGYAVRAGSRSSNRYRRLVEILAMLIRGGRHVEVTIVQVYSGPSFFVADLTTLLSRLLGHSIVLHLHGGNLPAFMDRHPGWAGRVLRRANAVVAPSSYLAEAAGRLGARPVVIPNLIRPELYPHRVRETLRPRLLWMRSFHEVYNPLMALRALARVRETVADATLVMAGPDKGLVAAARAEAARLGVADAVAFPGFLDASGKAREGDAADIFLNTNRVDNAPVAVVEAAAMGLPVVATAVGGIPELLRDEATALFVDDDDDRAMADAVLRLLRNPYLARRLSENGRRLAEDCFWERVLPRWETLFAGLPATSRIPVPAEAGRAGMGAAP